MVGSSSASRPARRRRTGCSHRQSHTSDPPTGEMRPTRRTCPFGALAMKPVKEIQKHVQRLFCTKPILPGSSSGVRRPRCARAGGDPGHACWSPRLSGVWAPWRGPQASRRLVAMSVAETLIPAGVGLVVGLVPFGYTVHRDRRERHERAKADARKDDHTHFIGQTPSGSRAARPTPPERGSPSRHATSAWTSPTTACAS